MTEAWGARWRHDPRWRVLAGSFATLVLVQGATYSFPVFLVPLAAEFGGQRGLVAAAFSLHNLVVGLTATAVGPLLDRFGTRRVFVGGAVALGLGLALAGTAASPLGLLGWFGVAAGLGGGVLGSVAQTVVLARWFPRARGTVVGLALSGMGVGMFLFGPATALGVARLGWRAAFAALGGGTTALLLPILLLASTSEPDAAAPPAAGTGREPGLVAVLRSGRFWCFALAFFFTPVSNFMVTTHQVAAVVDAGVAPAWAATAFGAVGLLSALGRAGFGALSDRWGRVPAALASYAATGLGTLLLLLMTAAHAAWMLPLFVLSFGLTLGARGPIIAALAADVYRGRVYGTVLGLITLGNRIGSAIGPWLGGVLYDLTGSYRAAFAVALGALAIAATALAGAGRRLPAAP